MDYSCRTLNKYIYGGMEGRILFFSPGKKKKKREKTLCDFLQPSGYLIAVTETHRVQDIAWQPEKDAFDMGGKKPSYLLLFIQVISRPNGTS